MAVLSDSGAEPVCEDQVVETTGFDPLSICTPSCFYGMCSGHQLSQKRPKIGKTEPTIHP
jgi:hypothetical protein